MSKSSSISCDDSVCFLKRWIDKYSSHRVKDLVYLDSFDINLCIFDFGHIEKVSTHV